MIKNKKGFTLVELLAVIVILALIMSIAIVSMTGIMENARYSTFNDTARSIISGVRSQLLAANQLRAGDYYFTASVLENNGKLPFGGGIKYVDSPSGTQIGSGIYSAGNGTTLTCAKAGNSPSFVRVAQDSNGKYVFSICIGNDSTGSGYKYMKTTPEADLQDNTKAGIFDLGKDS